MLQRTIAGAAGLLVLFHAWLLGSQLWDGQLAEPELVLRWVIAAGLILSLLVLRRSGAEMVLGRKAISIWLLAALLHGPAMAGPHDKERSFSSAGERQQHGDLARIGLARALRDERDVAMEPVFVARLPGPLGEERRAEAVRRERGRPRA